MLTEFLDFANIWGWYLFIATLQLVVMMLVRRAYKSAKNWLDREFPDDMPMTTGEWVREEVRRRNLDSDIDVVVSEGDDEGEGGAYSPAGQVIELGAKTFFKKDPTFWAIGAHELGHALMHHRFKLVASLLLQSRVLEGQLTSFGVVCLLTNIAFGSPELTQLAYWLIVGGVVCTALELIDEAGASTLALRMLGRDHRLNRRQWVGVLVTLSSAFATYLGSFIAKLILLIEFDSLIRMLEDHVNYQPGSPLAGWQLSIVGVLSIGLALVALISLARMIWPGQLSTTDMRIITRIKLANSVMLIPLVLFIWDQSEIAYWAIWVALASRPLIWLIYGLIAIVCLGVVWFLGLLIGPIFAHLAGDHDSGVPFRIPSKELVEEIAYTKRVRAKNAEDGVYTQWTLRTHHLINLVYVPMLLAFWY